MARYNRWMNSRLYAATGQLGDAEARADRGAFFGSILSTLEHILAADEHWLRRFATGFPKLASLDAVRSEPLPELVRGLTSPDLERLRARREVIDDVLVAFTLEATDAVYAAPMTYANSAGESFTREAGLVLRHVFNHQTHHRGQATTLFSQPGVDVGVTDLSALIPAWEPRNGSAPQPLEN
ncbi:DinB family protein [Frateuria sp. GZRe12]|uniref:DinB family protein n=1 Tax=Frateuria sp. GZRe12 TaxID=3351533 RepID=UPI003EDC4676